MGESKRVPRHFLSPLLAGAGLGMALYLAFLFTGHGLGAFGFFRDLTAAAAEKAEPFWAAENLYLMTFLYEEGPFSTWIAWEVLGVGIGALLGSLATRRFRFKVERGPRSTVVSRLFFAFLGGLVASLGAALARGCTSALGLSGAAVLSTGAFLFLGTFFLAGIATSLLLKRLWQ